MHTATPYTPAVASLNLDYGIVERVEMAKSGKSALYTLMPAAFGLNAAAIRYANADTSKVGMKKLDALTFKVYLVNADKPVTVSVKVTNVPKAK